MDAYRKPVTVAAVALFLSAAVAAVVLPRLDREPAVAAMTPAVPPHAGFGGRPEAWPSTGPLAELEFTHRDDLAAVPLTGQFAAELAADHATAPATILAEHQRLRRSLSSDEHPVVLLRSTDLAHPAGDTGAWLTVALGDFPDVAAVTAWCSTVPAPHCVPRRLDPPR